MLFVSKFFKTLCVSILVLTLSSSILADTLRLKDGRIIKGKIVKFDGGKFTVVFDDGARQRQITYSADEIESINFDSNSMPATNINTAGQIPSDSSNQTKVDNTIITVGQNKNPQTVAPPEPQPVQTVKTSAETPKPITFDVKVLADNTTNGWTNSGWVVRKGQKIRISGSGRVSLGNGRFSPPGGIASLADGGKLKKDQPTGGLIAVIGDDNNDFIFVGNSLEFVAARDGALFLGVNEGNLDDNSGAFEVKIEIEPEIGG